MIKRPFSVSLAPGTSHHELICFTTFADLCNLSFDSDVIMSRNLGLGLGPGHPNTMLSSLYRIRPSSGLVKLFHPRNRWIPRLHVRGDPQAMQHLHTSSVRAVAPEGAVKDDSEEVGGFRTQNTDDHGDLRGSLNFEGFVEPGSKVRLDQWLSRQLPRVSRARVQNSIRNGLASVNGCAARKTSAAVRGGDFVQCRLIGPTAFEAEPEDIALDVAFEDEHLLVINKPAHMVVHPAPGHSSGTLVNALLHHCGLPSMRSAANSKGLLPNLGADEVESEQQLLEMPWDEEGDDLVDDNDEEDYGNEMVSSHSQDLEFSGPTPVIRPGIVHRLDKGTSGLLVVAKDDYTHEELCNQFKARTVRRSYLSLVCGLPPSPTGRVEVSVGRDLRDRKRMAAFPVASSSCRVRHAASNYRILEVLGRGGSALVEWRLETGRTHQIRVHAQHLGYPLLGDDVYGGTTGAAAAKLLPLCPSEKHGILRRFLANIERPCLHAERLGFRHPWTGVEHDFTCPMAHDFAQILGALRKFGGFQ